MANAEGIDKTSKTLKDLARLLKLSRTMADDLDLSFVRYLVSMAELEIENVISSFPGHVGGDGAVSHSDPDPGNRH